MTIQHSSIVESLRKRLATASQGDRAYERPMSWDEADTLLALIDTLAAQNAQQATTIAEQAGEIERLTRERDEARKKAGKLHDYANMRDVQIVRLPATARLPKSSATPARQLNQNLQLRG